MRKIFKMFLTALLCAAFIAVSLLSAGCAKAAEMLDELDDLIEDTAEAYIGISPEEWFDGSAGTNVQSTPAATDKPEEAAAANKDGTVRVSNVDEFLAALGSGKIIVLGKGTYDLTAAADYGQTVQGKPYTWEEVYDGFELVLSGIDGLTVRAADDDNTSVVTSPRYAQVIRFENCSNVLLHGITFGHTPETGTCAGCVLMFNGCTACKVDDCKLFGCGILGVSTTGSSAITLYDTDIYQCSAGAVQAADTNALWVTDCDIHDCGSADEPCGGLISLLACEDVSVTETDFEKCFAYDLLDSEGGGPVSMTDCEVKDCTFTDSVFFCDTTGIVLSGTEFERVDAQMFANGRPPVTPSGNVIEGEPAGVTVTWVPDEEYIDDYAVQDIPSGDLPTETVYVHTADEFLAAVRPDTVIRLEADIDLTDASSYGQTVNSAFFRWDEVYDGYELVIFNVEDLSVIARDDHVISTVPRYANVLTFENTEDLLFDGVTLGHTEEPGECAGGVLKLYNCDDVELIGCRLFGCGTVGIDAEYSEELTVISTEIYDCSYNAVQLIGVREVSFLQCSIRDCGMPHICLFDVCRKVRWNGEALTDAFYNIENGRVVSVQ